MPADHGRPRPRLRWSVLGAALLLLVAACGGAEPPAPAAPPHRPPVQPGEPGPPFPRTAVYFLEHEDLPSAQTLARYDLVVLDSEWDNRLPGEFFTELRQRNPDIVLLAYVNVVDRPPRLGSADRWADRYALWQFDSDTHSTFPEQWLAKTSDGDSVSEWPDSVMTNLTDRAPRVNGRTFAEHAVDWMVNQVWGTGVWDGIFLDVWGDAIYGASHDSWDIDRDGADEPAQEIYGAGNPWERGVAAAERSLRERIPEAILVGNGDRTLRAGHLNGRVWESFADERADRDPEFDVQSYVTITGAGEHRQPGVALTINQRWGARAGSDEDARRGRFFLTATLLHDGYWAAMGSDYGELAEYDELDGGGLGPGYLGYPLRPNPTVGQLQGEFAGDGLGQVADGVFRRDFEHGIVLCNLGTEERTITLEQPYRHLRGSRDRETNNGETVTRVTVGPHDGLILLR